MVPDLDQYRAAARSGIALLQRCNPRSQTRGRRLRWRLRPSQNTEAPQTFGNVGQAFDAVAVSLQPPSLEPVDLRGGGAAAPDDHDVRMQRQNTLEIKTLAIAHAFEALRRRRLVGAIPGSEDLLARPGRKSH